MLHRQRSLLSGDVVVVSVRPILELPAFVLDGAGGDAALRLRTLYGNVGDALAVNEAPGSELRVSLIGGQRAAVIFLFRGPGRNRHRTLVDSELAVLGRDLELIGHVIAMGVFHDRGSHDLIRIGTRIGSGHAGAHAFNSEGHLIFVGIDIARHARHRMFFAVIGNRVRASGNRNRVLILAGARVDHQLAKHKLHVIVVELSAGGVGGVELVLIRTRQDVVFVIPGEFVFGQNAIFAHEAVAAHFLVDIRATLQRLAVVILVTTFGRQDNGTLANGKHAVTLNPELHVDVVLGGITLERELRFGKAHLVLAGISALCFCLTGEADIAFTHTSRQTGNVVARDALLFTAVLLAAVVAGNRNGNLVGNGADVQVAGRRLGHDILVIGADLADGAIRKLIRVVPGVRALAALERYAVEAGARAFGKVRRVAFDALLGAVIGFGIGIRLQRNVLAIVELHHVLRLVGAELEVLDVIVDRRVTGNRLGLKPGDLVAHMARTLLA